MSDGIWEARMGTGTMAAGAARDAEDAPCTREEHVAEVARWQRLTDAARAWSGRGGLSALGKDRTLRVARQRAGAGAGRA